MTFSSIARLAELRIRDYNCPAHPRSQWQASSVAAGAALYVYTRLLQWQEVLSANCQVLTAPNSLLSTLLGAVSQLALPVDNYTILVDYTRWCLLGLLYKLVALLSLVCCAGDLDLSTCEIKTAIGPTAVPLRVTLLIPLPA